MANVEEKQPVIDEIAELVKDAATVVLVDYRGLTVAEDTDLRRQLREADVTYRVYKNSMINFAIKDTEFADLTQHLAGPTAIAVCKEDATAAARILAKFAKDAEALEIKGGVVEGEYYDSTTIGEIASIPSKDELLSKFLGSIQSPITDFARVLKQIADKDGEEDAAEEAAPAEEAAEEAPAEEASTEEEATEEEAPAEEEATEEEAPAEEEATEEEAPAEEEATEEEAPAEEEATEEEAPAEEEAAEEAPEEEAEEAPADDAE